MLVVEYVVDGEVVVLKVLSPQLCNSWTLSEEVWDRLLFITTHRTCTGVRFADGMETTVSRDEYCSSVFLSVIL